MKTAKILCTIIIFCLASTNLNATTITSIDCGSWTNPFTWDLNRIPVASDTIKVNTFVYFNTDFTSLAPGMLNVTICGTLCGLHHYTGCFILSGITYVSALTANYGHSVSDADINVLQTVIVNGTGSYEVVSGYTCVGCTSLCQNCETANKIDCSQSINSNSTDAYSISFSNPSSYVLSLRGITHLTNITIYDIMGNLIIEKETNNDITIDTGNLSNGIYSLILEDKKKRMVSKIMITK